MSTNKHSSKKQLQHRPFRKFAFVSVQQSVSADALADKAANRDIVRSHARRARIKKEDEKTSTVAAEKDDNGVARPPPPKLSDQVSKFRLSRPIAVSNKKRLLKSRLELDGKVGVVDAKAKSVVPVPVPVPGEVDFSSTITTAAAVLPLDIMYQPTALKICRDCGIADPFDSLPIAIGPQQQKLLSYYSTNLTQSFVAFDPNKELIIQSNSDPAWLNATFSLLALHHDLRTGKGLSSECLYHRGEALRLVNERLSRPTSPSNPISESTLGAVASLVNFDITAGSNSHAAMHMTGLQHMVKLQGGLSAFNHNRVLQSLISWSDLLFSSGSDQLPTFQFTCPSSRISGVCVADVRAYENHIARSPGFNTKMRETIRILRLLSFKKIAVIQSLHKPDDFNLIARTEFSNCMYLAEYRLLTLFDDIASVHESRILRKPWQLSVYLYLHLALRDLPGISPIEHNLSKRLRASLELVSDLCDLWVDNLSLLLWILFIGAAATVNSPEDRHYFVNQMVKVKGRLGVVEKSEFVGVLKSCMWLEGFCGAHAREVWDDLEVERMRVEGGLGIPVV